MRMLSKSVMALGLAALMTTPVMAQQRRGGGGFGGRGGGGVAMLLGNASVQEELKLDDSQKEKVREFAEKAREKMASAREELQNLDQQERGQKMREMMVEANASALKAAGEMLKPEQVKRLHQIELQVSGVNAFQAEHLQKKLSITDDQKSDIDSIVEGSNSEMREIFQGSQGDREGAMAKIRELRKDTLAKVQGKLTPEQKTKYTELLGSPFEIKFEGGPGGGRNR